MHQLVLNFTEIYRAQCSAVPGIFKVVAIFNPQSQFNAQMYLFFLTEEVVI